MKRIRIAAALCVLLLVGVLTGCAKRDSTPKIKDFQKVQETETLRIGVAECPPFSSQTEEGTWSGFDVELAQALCKKLGVTAEFVPLDWETRTQALADGTVDCLWSGLTARSDLTEAVDFSESYLASRPCVVVSAESVDSWGGVSDFQGVKLAVETESAGQSAASLCLPGAELVLMPSQVQAMEAVAAGTADAAVVDLLVGLAAVQERTELAVLEHLELGTEEFAVALRKGSDLTGRFNEILAGLEQDGTVEALAETYGLTDNLIAG